MRRVIFCIFVISTVCAGQSSTRAKSIFGRTMLNFDTTTFSPLRIPTSSTSMAAKSVPTAMGLSLVLPGAGQLYAQKGNESLIKGAAFMALEATNWILYFHYRNKGKDIEKKYEAYADANWEVNNYLRFLETVTSRPSGDLGQGTFVNDELVGVDFQKLYDAETDFGGSHKLPHTRTQQYYEMIYKYPRQFGQGWSDADPTLIDPLQPSSGYDPLLTQNMIYYRSLRNRSNANLASARMMTSLMVVNRFLSTIDAAWTVKRKNRDATRVGMAFRFENRFMNGRFIIMPTLNFSF